MSDQVPDPNSDLWNHCKEIVIGLNETGNLTCVHNGPIVEYVTTGEAAIVLPSIIYTAVLMTLGLPGNLAVIIVYLFKMDKTPSRRFFISLAICDFLNCSFGMPVELALLSNFHTFDYPMLCRISRFTNFFLNNTSSCLHIAIAVDRYRRIRHPLHPAMTVGCFHVICTIAFSWSFISASPALFIYGTKSKEFTGKNGTVFISKTCHVDDNADGTLRTTFAIYLLIATLLTFFLLITLYGLITRLLLRRRHFLCNSNSIAWTKDSKYKSVKSHRASSSAHVHISLARTYNPENGSSQTQVLEPFRDRTHSDLSGVTIHGIKIRVGRTTFILFIVTLVFMLSFIPYLVIVNLRYTIPGYTRNLSTAGWQAFHIALRSYLINSSVNPLIYCFLNKDFRRKVFAMLKEMFYVIVCK